MKRTTKSPRNRESGQILVLVAISLVVVIGFAALSIDVGIWLHQKTKVQADVDAMALAGSHDLCGTSECDAKAIDTARAYGPKNNLLAEEVEFVTTSQDCSGKAASPAHSMVSVQAVRDQKAFLASVLGITGAKIRACATAGKYALGGTSGVRPFALERACIDGTKGPLVVYGDAVTLKFDSDGKGTCSTSQGNFAPVRIDGSGSSVYGDTIRNGSKNSVCTDTTPSCCAEAGPECQSGVYELDTETGNKVGDTRKAIQDLMDNTPTKCDSWDKVQVNGKLTQECIPWASDYSGGTYTKILIVPVVDGLWDGGGKNTVTIKRFAVVFLDGWDTKNGKCTGGDCDIKARFIQTIVSLPNATLVPFVCAPGDYCPNDLTVAKIIQ